MGSLTPIITMTDTPITDSRQAYEWSINNGAISADFSRGLERENTQLAARVKELKGDGAMLDWLERHPSAFIRWWEIPVENESLRDAIRSAMKQKARK